MLDITANNGEKILAKRYISPADFKLHEDYETIELKFTSNEHLANVEFRIYYFGGVNLYFDSIKLEEI